VIPGRVDRCDPKNVYRLKGNDGQGVTLSDVGTSIADFENQ
jgi:hypothetical protein